MVFLKYIPDHITVLLNIRLLNILPRPFLNLKRKSQEYSKPHRLNCLPVPLQFYFWFLLVLWISQVLWIFYAFVFAIPSSQVGLLPTQITCKSWRLSMGFTPSEQASPIASSSCCQSRWVRGIYNVLPLSFTSIPGQPTELKSYLLICLSTRL